MEIVIAYGGYVERFWRRGTQESQAAISAANATRVYVQY